MIVTAAANLENGSHVGEGGGPPTCFIHKGNRL